MKTKTVVGLLLIAALILMVTSTTALADGTYGGLLVTGGTENTDYSYAGSRLAILTGTPLTLSGSTAATNIVIEKNVKANLTLQDASIDARTLGAAIHLFDGAALNLTVLGNNTLWSKEKYGGIEVASGKTLVITVESTGTLNVTGGFDGAGIGGGENGGGGHITIWNGTINAKGNHDGAGIGSGKSGNGGTIIIRGGTVNATGGTAAGGRIGVGAGIGSAVFGDNGNITISGGTVNAQSSMWSAGIGGGWGGDGGNITISGGTINATGHSGGAGIGGGSHGHGGNITISGGTVTATGNSGGSGIGGGDGGNGGTVRITQGVVFANAATGPKDVGAGQPNEDEGQTDGSLEISGAAALFLKNNTCPSSVTSAHTHISVTNQPAGASVYGYPVAWSGNFGAYLFLYPLSYDLGGGESVPANPPYYGPQCGSFTLTNPTKTGYSFAGWSGTGITEPSFGVSILPGMTGKRDYTANWTANTYTVHYDANGGAGSTASSSHTYDEAAALTANGFTKTGYTFGGWAAGAEGTAVYGNGQSVSNLTAEEGGTVTLFATWIPNPYTVAYDANGGAGNTASSSHTYDEAAALTANGFTKTGYTFRGWATGAKDAAVYGNGQSVSNLTAQEGGTVTLFAVWIPNSYTVAYDANGGAGSTASSSHTYDEAAALTANGFTKSGYTFGGWATDAKGAAVYSNGQSVSNLTAQEGGTVTLFAVWEANREATPTLSGTIVYCKSGVNVRSGPGTNYPVIGFAPKNATYTVTSQSGAWYKVEFGGSAGYISASYLSVSSMAQVSQPASPAAESGRGMVVNCNRSVNVRSGPGTNYSIIGSAPRNEVYTVIGQFGAWYQIAFGGTEGYIAAEYFSLSSGLPVLQPPIAQGTFVKGTIVNCNYSVNVRSGPGTNHSIIGSAPKGATYTVIEKSGAWYKIEFNGQTAYVFAHYFLAGNA